jgi:hypothetical protein
MRAAESTMKHVMGVIGVLLAMWGIGSVYNAVVDIEWLQGAFGVSTPACCARAATGHATAPPSSVMNSRRFTRSPRRRPRAACRARRSEHPCRAGVDHQLKLRRLNDRQVRRLSTLENAVTKLCPQSEPGETGLGRGDRTVAYSCLISRYRDSGWVSQRAVRDLLAVQRSPA